MSTPAPAPDLTDQLQQIADALSGEIDLDRLLEEVVDVARTITGAAYGALGVLDSAGTQIVRFIHAGMDPATVALIGAHPTGGGLLGEVIRHPHPIIADPMIDHPASSGFPPHHPPMRSFLGVPVRAGGRIFGNLYLTDKPGGFVTADTRLCTILAVQAGLAIHAAQLADGMRSTAVQAERDRISRDLHDGVIQTLFSIGMGLESAKPVLERDPAAAGDRIDRAVDQLDGTIREIRNTIFTLRPGAADAGLQEGLVELAREYEVNEILRPTLNISQSLDAAVPEAVVPDVLHIVREALSNAAKHAQASQVLLDAVLVDGWLDVRVRDTGGGFDTDLVTPGNGLGNIAERAVLLGAELEVTSAVGGGTTVHLRVPLDVNGGHG